MKKPSLEEVQDYCLSRRNGIDAGAFVDFYESKGWLIGKSPMKDWKCAVRTWERSRKAKQVESRDNFINRHSDTSWAN